MRARSESVESRTFARRVPKASSSFEGFEAGSEDSLELEGRSRSSERRGRSSCASKRGESRTLSQPRKHSAPHSQLHQPISTRRTSPIPTHRAVQAVQLPPHHPRVVTFFPSPPLPTPISLSRLPLLLPLLSNPYNPLINRPPNSRTPRLSDDSQSSTLPEPPDPPLCVNERDGSTEGGVEDWGELATGFEEVEGGREEG